MRRQEENPDANTEKIVAKVLEEDKRKKEQKKAETRIASASRTRHEPPKDWLRAWEEKQSEQEDKRREMMEKESHPASRNR